MPMKEYVKLVIPEHLIIPACGLFAGAVVTAQSFVFNELIVPFISFAFIFFAFNALNGVFDKKIDAINKPMRPIPSGAITENNAFVFSIILYVLGVLIAFSVSNTFGLVAMILMVLTILYTTPPAYFKKIFIVSNINAALAYALMPMLGGWAVVGGTMPIVIFAFITLIAAGFISVKDFEDYLGDSVYNVKTLPVIYGTKASPFIFSLLIIIPFLLIAAIISLDGNGIDGKLYLPLGVSLVISLGFIQQLYKNAAQVIHKSRKDIVYHTNLTRWAIVSGAVIEIIFALGYLM
jgi:geranylgeranylglycerol-phosphate geranylgeranyltransferase